MRSSNPALIIGILISLCMIFLALFPGLLSDQGPYVIQSMRSWVEDGSVNFERAPFRPSTKHPMGTDDRGRDIWSRIAHGTRLTLGLGLLVVVGRFIIALPVALAAGFGNAPSRTALRLSGILFSAIPALLISIIILQQELFRNLSRSGSVLAFVVVLSAVGWAKLGLVLEQRTEEVLARPFIMSERAIGKSGFRIAIENVVPHLIPEVVVLFFMEIARALSMIMQLGIFGVFVGNLRIVRSTDAGQITFFNVSFEPEWAGMLGTARSRMSTAPWMVIYPTLAFFVCVLGFNFLGEGLRQHFHRNGEGRRKSWANLTRRYRTLVGTAVFLVVLAALTVPGLLADARKPDMELAPEVILPSPAVIGTDTAAEASEIIREQMMDLGIDPLEESGYFRDYKVPQLALPTSERLLLKSGSNQIEGRKGIDFSFLEITERKAGATVIDATRIDLLALNDPHILDGRFVLLDEAIYSRSTISWIIESLFTNSDIPGVILITDNQETLSNPVAGMGTKGFVLAVSRDFAANLIDSPSVEITVEAEASPVAETGRNIAGILPGTDPYLKRKAIVICVGYNGVTEGSNRIPETGLAMMKYLVAGEDNRRSYIFMFLDGTLTDSLHGLWSYKGFFPYNSADVELYLDLTGIRAPEFDTMVFNTEQAPITRYYAWSFGHLMDEYMDKLGITPLSLPMANKGGEYVYVDTETANIMFWSHGLPSIRVGSAGAGKGSLKVEEIGSLLLQVLERNDY